MGSLARQYLSQTAELRGILTETKLSVTLNYTYNNVIIVIHCYYVSVGALSMVLILWLSIEVIYNIDALSMVVIL